MMMRQRPDQRPESIEIIKQRFIANQQDFVARQRLDAIKNTVVSTTTLSDPLAEEPPKVVGFDWSRGRLTLILDRPVSDGWVHDGLLHIGSFSSLMGKDPNKFRFSGDCAMIDAREHEIQRIIDDFKGWLPRATQAYGEHLRNEQRRAEEAERAKLRAEQEELETQRRVRASVTI